MFAGGFAVCVALLGMIAGHEGYSEEAYLDSAGVPTVGYGTTLGVKMGDTITREMAEALLMRDAEFAGEAVKRCVKAPLYQHEYDAYVSLTYNIGSGAFCRSTLVKKLNAGDYTGACNELPRWVYAGGKRLRGLEIRREKERQMCLYGIHGEAIGWPP
jgi:lysozyme